jgi:hypothetical protein
MATYRLEAKIIGRSQGRSATGAAAYRAGAEIADARTGRDFDYTRKRGVLHTEILTPPGTPDWMSDRAQLWNAVERIEKRKDAQLAREILLSLPHELTTDQRRELVRDFARAEFVSAGMIADIAIHAPDRRGDERNHHAHILLTTRELAGDGFGPKAREWNDTARLEGWRVHWQEMVNRELERHGHDARVDHRSLEAQGIDREPEPKQGPVATEMEREGRASHAGNDRRAAQARNEERAALAVELEEVAGSIVDLEQERAKRVGQGGMSQQSAADEEEARRALEAAAQRQRDQERAADDARLQAAQEAAKEPENSRVETPASLDQQARPPVNQPAPQAEIPSAPQEQQPDPLDAARQRAAEEQSRQAAKEAERVRIEALARENADHQITQAEELREQRARLDRFEADRQRQAEEARQETERKRQADAHGQQAEGEIRDAGDRYRVALGQHYDVRDPYGSLARSAMAEYGSFIRDREQLKAQIAKEQDPEARRALELRQDIEANDYMAITSKRIASQSEIITGRRDSEEAVRFRDRAAGYEEQSKELRQQYRDLAAERAARDAAKREAEDKQKRERDDTARRDQTTESRAVKEEKARDAALLGRGEISDAKAERIARIREQGRQFESAEKVRETGRSQDKGGRSR